MIDVTSRTRHYSPRIGSSRADLLDRLTRACRLAGVPAPTLAAEVHQLLDREATVEQLEQTLGLEAVTADDPELFLEDAMARMTRAQAVGAIRLGLSRVEPQTLNRVGGQLRQQALDAIESAAARTIVALTKAAKALPQGDPLDLAAIIDADSTRAMREAGRCLEALAVYRSVHEVGNPAGNGPDVAAVLPVVDIADVEEEQIDRLTDAPLSPASPERDGIRAFARSLRDDGKDAALVRAARGEFAGVHLALAATASDMAERQARVDRALTQRRVDSWGKRKISVR